MSKKEYLMTIFEKIEPYRPIVSGFIALLNSPLCTDEDIDAIFTAFSDHISSIQDEQKKKHAQQILSHLEKIHHNEELLKKEEELELDKLLEQIEHL